MEALGWQYTPLAWPLGPPWSQCSQLFQGSLLLLSFVAPPRLHIDSTDSPVIMWWIFVNFAFSDIILLPSLKLFMSSLLVYS